MPKLEQQFEGIREAVRQEGVQTPAAARELEYRLTKEEMTRLRREQPLLAERFQGAQEYIHELQQRNSELEQAAKEQKELSRRDALTGLLNARGFDEKARTLYSAVAYGTTGLEKRMGMGIAFNVIFVDLNDFKPINDTFGHEAGDEALKVVAKALLSAARTGDLVARKGGDEFVIAYLGRESETGSRGVPTENRSIVATRVSRALEETGFEYKGQRIPPITACIGAAKAMRDERLDEVIHRADLAVLDAKKDKEKAREAGAPAVSYIEIAEGLNG